MDFFKSFHSNTVASSANQSFFRPQNPNTIYTGRVYYKISAGGTYNYSFLFSNTIDSTYDDGSYSYKNLICEEWNIIKACVGICESCDEYNAAPIENLVQLYFDGSSQKTVGEGELFSSDPVELSLQKDKYLCFEISFSGTMIPCHPESLLPIFTLEGGEWVPSKFVPLPSMIGCDRRIKSSIAYLGDSITQGIGVQNNSYLHWNALLSNKLSDDYSFWNLGIGFGRAEDAASDGAWLFKAKQNDIVVVCYGVNDILQGRKECQIKQDLTKIVKILKNDNIKVVLQTIPPFNYVNEKIDIWKNLNNYIKNELSLKADLVFDVVDILKQDDEHPFNAKYGGHPNEEGCRMWADGLFPIFSKFLEN